MVPCTYPASTSCFGRLAAALTSLLHTCKQNPHAVIIGLLCWLLVNKCCIEDSHATQGFFTCKCSLVGVSTVQARQLEHGCQQSRMHSSKLSSSLMAVFGPAVLMHCRVFHEISTGPSWKRRLKNSKTLQKSKRTTSAQRLPCLHQERFWLLPCTPDFVKSSSADEICREHLSQLSQS